MRYGYRILRNVLKKLDNRLKIVIYERHFALSLLDLYIEDSYWHFMNKILLLTVVLGILSCNRAKQGEEIDPKDEAIREAIRKDFPIATKLLDSLITTPQGSYYKFIPHGPKEFTIEWGNNKVKKTSKEKYHLMAAQTIGFSWESDQFIVLHNEYTKLGRYDYFLPLKGDSAEYVVENALLYDTARNLVASEQPFKDAPILIENYVTRRTQPVIENHGCDAILIEFCLDSIAFQNELLYYKLALPRLDAQNRTFTERTIRIKI